jgi:hypothetical protein
VTIRAAESLDALDEGIHHAFFASLVEDEADYKVVVTAAEQLVPFHGLDIFVLRTSLIL